VNVLLLHNRYREAGGEERAVGEIAALLRARGHDVELLERASASRGRLAAGAGMVRGGLDPDDVAEAVSRTGAEIVHAHNVNPLFGPRALEAARRAGARVVMHLHNYRLVCAVAINYRDGGVCTRCRGRNTWPGVRLRCRGNVPEALAYGAGIALHQRGLLEAADRLIVPSAFAKARLSEIGVPVDGATVLHNFLRGPEFATEAAGGGEYALYVGRLSDEKGPDVAIEAAALSGVPVAVAGSGPEAGRYEELARRRGAPVRFLGRLGSEELARARRGAAFAVAPSKCDEPCPYAVIEAMAAGLPVLGSTAGGIPELVGDVETIPVRSVERWAAAMRELWDDRAARERAAEAARARALELFGEDRFYSGLMDVYEKARAAR
jgi:glycosyltransferase involved in cell wall biosynthesis